MKFMKWIMVTLMALTLLGSAGGVLAQEETPSEAGRGGVRGEVTAVSDTNLTITTRNGQSVTVNVTHETEVLLIGNGGEGSLSDIQVGDLVGVRGPKNEDGSIQARLIALLPADFEKLDKIRGKVTAIEGDTIVVENREGSQRITTTAETKFRRGKEEGSLADVEVSNFVFALGEKQADSFVAKVVVAVTKEQLKKHTLRGQVLSVDASAGILTVESLGGKEGTWTVKATPETKYRVPGTADPALADIPVGAQVIVLGQPDEGDSKSGTARFIGVIPVEAQGSARTLGEVIAINGATFTLQSLRRGELTIVTDDSTQYLTRGEQEVSLANIKVGTKVIVMGELVEGEEKSIQAKLVGIQLR